MNKTTFTKHKSVLTREVLEYLNPEPEKLYVDATFGSGGHTRAILEAESACHVIAIDWDEHAIEEYAPALEEEFGERFTMLWGNFALLHKLLRKAKIKQIDGILADFGTSQFQIFKKEGFSFRIDTPLDMRMSPAHQRQTAADLVNSLRERDLAQIFLSYGEESFGKRIAQAIVQHRKKHRIATTKELADVVSSAIPRSKHPKTIHPATKVFQALRIKVNRELENIQSFLSAALNFLSPGGKIVCISFHSLEDRLVKNFFKDHVNELETLTPKPVGPSKEESEQNPSARSAKLRAARKY